MSELTTVDLVGLLVGDLNAELLLKCVRHPSHGIGSLGFPEGNRAHTSSMAMTTSTVSKLSRPRSLEKWEAPLIWKSSRFSS
jgi:hypothetical protein